MKEGQGKGRDEQGEGEWVKDKLRQRQGRVKRKGD